MQYLLQIPKQHLTGNWFVLYSYLLTLMSNMYLTYLRNTEGGASQ